MMTKRKLLAAALVATCGCTVAQAGAIRITSYFGVRSDPFEGNARMHKGLDIAGPIGTPVYATGDGVVLKAGAAGGYGNMIDIGHGNGIESIYGHLSRILVAKGTAVRQGTMIGLMGSTGRSTGSHLHYEVRIYGKAVDPRPYLVIRSTISAAQMATYQAAPSTAVSAPPQVQRTGHVAMDHRQEYGQLSMASFGHSPGSFSDGHVSYSGQ